MSLGVPRQAVNLSSPEASESAVSGGAIVTVAVMGMSAHGVPFAGLGGGAVPWLDARVLDSDREEALRRVLAGLARGDDANDISASVADLHVRNDTFPGEVFMQLAVDALEHVGVARDDPFDYGELVSVHLPEVDLRGRSRSRFQYAVLTTFAVRGGLDPDLLDEVTYWIEQYWQFALLAAIAVVRACAARSQAPAEVFVEHLAANLGIDIA
jgi:hypothetical protein